MDVFRYKANVFSSKRERTYEMLLQDMYDNFWSQGTDASDVCRANSGSIKLYGHQRKAQEQMVTHNFGFRDARARGAHAFIFKKADAAHKAPRVSYRLLEAPRGS